MISAQWETTKDINNAFHNYYDEYKSIVNYFQEPLPSYNVMGPLRTEYSATKYSGEKQCDIFAIG